MLHLVLGPAGTGKTTYLLEDMKTKLSQGQKVILLVPEQYSFEAEKAVYRTVGPQLTMYAEVLSFTRLCNLIFRRYGGLAGNYITDPARCLLMSVALHEVKDHFKVYAKHSYSSTFLKDALGVVGELKTAGVSPEKLDKLRLEVKEGALEDKLSDLSLLYATYQLCLENGYADSQDDLIRACNLLEGKDFFADYVVYIDSFMAFMAGENRLLKQMIASCPDVYAALCCDGLYDSQEGMGVLSSVKKTAARLVRMAREQAVSVAKPVILEKNFRFQTAELTHLSKQLFADKIEPFAGEKSGTVRLLSASNPYEEIAAVASEIVRLVQQEGYRYRDIAVIARDLENYIPSIETLFPEYDIPFFLDRRAEIEHQPLIGTVLSALEAVKRGFPAEEVLRLAKSPVLGIDPEAAFELENYAYLWGVERGMWKLPFQNHPDGFCSTFDEQQLLRLKLIEQTRQQVIEPLMHLQERLRDCDGEQFAHAVFDYLEEIGAAERLSVRQDSGAMQPYWDTLMELLDQFAVVLRHRNYPLPQFIDLFRVMVNFADVGQIPQTTDQVVIGIADRVRPQSPKATFVIGANEGVFPAAGKGSGVFTDAERELLHQNHLELGFTPDQRMMNERFYSYFALTTPSHYLCLSFSRSTLAGEELSPSSLVRQLQKMFPKALTAAEQSFQIWRVVNPRTAYDQYCASVGGDNALAASLRASLQGTDYERLTHLSIASAAQWKLNDIKTARQLAGSRMYLSPSRVEQYFGCPFSYFCKAELKLRERRRAEYSPVQSGTAIHYVLAVMLSRFSVAELASLSAKALKEQIEAAVMEYLNENLNDYRQRPARFKYLFSRLTSTLVKLISHMAAELSQSEFVPAAFELPIREQEGVQPLELRLPDGARVLVEGVVDRVDIMQKGSERYVRVVDYKSGSKNFRLADVLYGLNLQMFIYLFSITKNGGESWQGTLPAGALYLPAKFSPVSAARDLTPEQLREKFAQNFKMDGLVLEDEAVIEGMEKDAAGVFIPVKRNRDGALSKTSSVASLEEMGRLERHIERLIVQMAQEVRLGRIEARPSVGMGYDPCEYCPYAVVCQREGEEDCRRLTEQDADAVWEQMEEEEKNG